MLSMDELLKGAKFEDQSQDIQDSLTTLLERVNKIRVLYGKPMTVTSGLRTMADHLRIYAEKGITDHSKIPMKSKHLFGQAVDIFDPDLALTKWLKENDSEKLVDAELYCEEGNRNWVHFQILPPKSGNRWFLP